jgi:uncharacterized protein (AIM24 family)
VVESTVSREVVASADGRGVRLEVHEVTLRPFRQAASSTLRAVRQVRVALNQGSALLEAGALQWARGQLQYEVQKTEGAGGFLKRQITSAGTGESAFATRYTGTGEVWTEPSGDHYLVERMSVEDGPLVLDDKAFYGCEGSIALGIHTNRNVSRALSGSGLLQPKLTGDGVFVVESPVPAEDVQVVVLDGREELVVDGDLMLMYSASLDLELRPLVPGLLASARSGEGLVFRFTGVGRVWLTPTAPVRRGIATAL